MNQGTQGYSLTKATEGRKSRDTIPLNMNRQHMILRLKYTIF
jgi:hypothetical protein